MQINLSKYGSCPLCSQYCKKSSAILRAIIGEPTVKSLPVFSSEYSRVPANPSKNRTFLWNFTSLIIQAYRYFFKSLLFYFCMFFIYPFLRRRLFRNSLSLLVMASNGLRIKELTEGNLEKSLILFLSAVI